MSNNLKKLEKELRSIAKRCKDVKYTKGLLLSFLFMGLFAFSLQASSISPITSMWENYNREKAENDRAMEKANNELLMLMKQGDHVVKSAWPSWQFGFNFMANSQLGVYKGFGGKYEDRKYDRSNDLTKYVFDASKNQYGATTLNIKGNEEAKSMVIDPASVHIRNYTNNPAEVTKLDVLGMYEKPVFNPTIDPLTGLSHGITIQTVSSNARTVGTSSTTQYTDESSRNIVGTGIAHENKSNAIAASVTQAKGTFVVSTGTGRSNHTTGNNNATYDAVTPGSAPITTISGNFLNGIKTRSHDGTTSSTNNFGQTGVNTYWSRNYGYYSYVAVNGNKFDNLILGTRHHSGHHGHDTTYEGWFDRGGGSFDGLITGETFRPSSIHVDAGTLTINDSDFSVDSQDGITNHSSVLMQGTSLVIENGVGRLEKHCYNNPNILDCANYFSATHYGTTFDVAGTNNNAILATAGTVETKNNISYNTTFNVAGTNNNGINMQSSGNAIIDDSHFTISGSGNGILLAGGATGNKVNNSSFTVTSGNGINLNSGTLANVDSSSFTVASGNGIYAAPSTTLTGAGTTSSNTFIVNGSNSNGIFLNNTGTTSIIGSFTISGQNSTGILINNGNTPTISGSTFTVSGGNSRNTSGIFMYNSNTLTVDPTTRFTVSGASVGIAVDNSGKTSKTINFNGTPLNIATSTPAAPVVITTVGGGNIGVNIQGGNYGSTNRDVKLTGTLDINMTGDSDIAYNNTDFANKLEITNGTLIDTGAEGYGIIKVSGNKNIVFLNSGFVKDTASTIELKNVSVNGNNNVVGYFNEKGNSVNTTGDIGWFSGSVKLQGIIGKATDSDKNIGVYAISSQNSTMTGNGIGYNTTPVTTIDKLDIADINIGFGPKSTNGVLIYAGKGTEVNVKNATTAANALVASTISDGVESNSGVVKWGYHTEESNVSTNTTIAYATGIIDASLFPSIYPSGANLNSSEINILSNVDMLSRSGTAYHAADGGTVNVVGKDTRAGGSHSIIAYADGKNSSGTSSKVNIDGKITAADHNILGDINNNSGTPINTRVSSNTDLDDTYDNIAAYAVSGGKINIENTGGAATAAKEKMATVIGTDVAVDKSLVYGMAAYASGSGSEVKFDSSNGGITVVTGEKGGLYAEDGGTIEFNGNIVNQNNVSSNGVITSDTTNATVKDSSTRNGKKGSSNDHENVTPFYVGRSATNKDAGITFNAATNIDMYDGVLLTGNSYYNLTDGSLDTNTNNASYSDYYKGTNTSDTEYSKAKYRGMENVTVNILTDRVNLGIINQAESQMNWDGTNAGGLPTGTNYLSGVAKYAGLKEIKNTALNQYESTLINSELKISAAVDLENKVKSTAGTTSPVLSNDSFNNIKMESTLVSIEGAVTGDIGIVNGDSLKVGQGLNMANSLYRWSTLNNASATWKKTTNIQSGYINKASVDVWGGTAKGNGNTLADSNIIGINVAYGKIENTSSGTVKVDHGYGIVGSDDSILSNKGTIEVTGKYAQTPVSGSTRNAAGFTAETKATGENYGIVGLSTNNVGYGENKTTIENVGDSSGSIGKVTVDGTLAVGIYAKNVNDTSGAGALKSNVNIKYDNKDAASPDLIKVNTNNVVITDRGVGIVLETDTETGTNSGGIITLRTKGNNVSSGAADIITTYNGIGIYGENTEIELASDSTGISVETKDKGAGIWVTDNSSIGKITDRSVPKSFIYNYTGAADKNGFGMIFGSTISNISTTATNWLDIKFTNTGATKEGIAGILVNTDENDRVINYGKITEDTSTTAEKAYGVVVNKGTVENHGDIELNDSTDITKANVGIFANSNDLTADIVNYGNIKVGTPGSTKSFGIYGYDITHGTREDALSPISGKGGTITIGKESYGIYSGDGTVKVTGGKLIVGDSTVTTASEQAVGVYIDDNTRLSKSARSGEVSADMEIDDYSFGIVVAENQNAKLPGASNTNYLTLGNGTYSVDSAGRTSSLMSTKTPEIIVGRAASRTPVDPDVDPLHTTYTSNSVYYYSADKLSKVDSWADIKMNGDYNYAFYTAGVANNMGTIDLRSKVDVASGSANLGYGNVGIYSTNYSAGASTNYGTITTGMSDLLNEEYSIGMAAGHYNKKTKEITREGHVVNRGIINVQEENGIGMFAVGSNSKAENYGDINLIGNNSIGMYLDRKATGINYGNIVTTGSGTGIKGIVALNGSIIKNYGTIKIEGNGGIAIQTDNLQNKTDNQTSDVYGGTETGTQESIQYVASSDTKTVGTGSTITVPSSVPLTEVKINGIDTPIFKVDTDATRLFGTATQATVIGSVQSGGTRIIDLSTWGDFGNTRNLAEATRIGMYVDTSGFQYTNPIDGLDNLKNLYEIDLLFGTEATMYTNSKAIQLGDNILTAYNDALKQVVTGGTTLKGLSSSITWLAKPVFNETTGLIDTVYLVKVPYQSYAVEGDDLTYYFAENLESKYDIASGNDKIIFNKLNSIGNGEGHILAQAIDEMKGHQYSNIQQRGQVTRDILFKEINYLRNEWANPSKDSNKIKSFGTKGEYKTDSAGVKDYNNNAYGVAYIHENETLSLGEKSGWYAGAVYNSFNFKDLGGSEEDQALINAGLFKSTPFDQNGSLTWTISGDAYVGLNNMRRRFWVVDKIFSSRANYVSYGVGITNEIAKEFGSVTGSGFSYKPYASVRVEYGRFTDIEEKGDMALEVKGNDYYSIRPEIGMQVKYSQPVFSGKTNFVAGFGVAVENELGKIGDAQNKARISGVYGNYYKLKGEKENRKGNLKTDLSIGLDNRRIGFAINVGYDTKGENLRGGISFRGMF